MGLNMIWREYAEKAIVSITAALLQGETSENTEIQLSQAADWLEKAMEALDERPPARGPA